MSKRKGCAFCPETANLTGEHLWSHWIGESLGKKDYTFTRKEADGTVRQWHGDTLKTKARVACGDCNNVWRSELERKIKPIIQNMILHASETVLQAREIALFAAVAFKNAVVADHMHENRPPFFTSTERRGFRRTLFIPSGVQMWLASMPTQRGLFKSMSFQTPRGTGRGFEFNVFTYGIGHLVVKVYTVRWMKKAYRRHANPPFLTQG